MPLHIEILYNEYNFVGAFAVASLLTLLAVADADRQDAGRAHRLQAATEAHARTLLRQTRRRLRLGSAHDRASAGGSPPSTSRSSLLVVGGISCSASRHAARSGRPAGQGARAARGRHGARGSAAHRRGRADAPRARSPSARPCSACCAETAADGAAAAPAPLLRDRRDRCLRRVRRRDSWSRRRAPTFHWQRDRDCRAPSRASSFSRLPATARVSACSARRRRLGDAGTRACTSCGCWTTKLAHDAERARAALEVRLINYRSFTAARGRLTSRRCTSAGLADGRSAVQRIESQDLYASSFPVFASTGEAIALIEARLPAATIDTLARHLVQQAADHRHRARGARGACGMVLGQLVAGPVSALTDAAVRLGQGDFSTSIPAGGPAEVGELARTMEDMRRNLVDLTGTLRRREAEAQAVLARHRRRRVRRRQEPRHPLPESAGRAAARRHARGSRRPLLRRRAEAVRRGRPAPLRFHCPILRRAIEGQRARPIERLQSREHGARTHGHHERRAGRWPAGAGDPRRDRAGGRAPRARLGARQHLARVPHAARGAARLDRAAARRARHHAAGAAARTGALARARHAAADAAHRQSAGERAHRVGPARHPAPERGARRGRRGRAMR